MSVSVSKFKAVMNATEVEAFVTVEKLDQGSLQARKLASGVINFYWRYTHTGKSERILIGRYDPTIPPKSLSPRGGLYGVAGARVAANGLAAKHQDAVKRGQGGLSGLRAFERASAVAEREATERASKHTLEKLLSDYCDHLMALERESHRNARSIFHCHITTPWPEVARGRASALTTEQVANILRRVHEEGKGRTANKLRSYLRAAFELARTARMNPKVPVKFVAYGITSNPVQDIPADGESNREAKRPLSAKEMRDYWRAIKQIDGVQGAALRLHLLCGGQRMAQLVRLELSNIERDKLLLRDRKGRPGKGERDIWVPITTEIRAALKLLPDPTKDAVYSLSSDGGQGHITSTTLSRWAQDVAQEVGIQDFQAKRIRSGVETLLASAGVGKDTRGRLQSHGISGVQDRHYDAHDYLPEKRKALDTLITLLEAKGNVRAIRAA
jgi:integrase